MSEPSNVERLLASVPALNHAGRNQSLMEIAQTTRQFKQAGVELAQKRQQLMKEIRHTDLLTQRVREDKQMWKRNLEARVSGRPIALTTQKWKSMLPLHTAKAARLDGPPMQVLPQITSNTAANSDEYPAVRTRDYAMLSRAAALDHCDRFPLNSHFKDNGTYAFAPDHLGISSMAPRSARNYHTSRLRRRLASL